jgi:hypothetical protein
MTRMRWGNQGGSSLGGSPGFSYRRDRCFHAQDQAAYLEELRKLWDGSRPEPVHGL